MRKTIWKYQCETTDKFVIRIPKGAEILTVQTQHSHPFIWVLVDPEEEAEERIFKIFGTGHAIVSEKGMNREYVGTFKQGNEILVFHLFEYSKDKSTQPKKEDQ